MILKQLDKYGIAELIPDEKLAENFLQDCFCTSYIQSNGFEEFSFIYYMYDCRELEERYKHLNSVISNLLEYPIQIRHKSLYVAVWNQLGSWYNSKPSLDFLSFTTAGLRHCSHAPSNHEVIMVEINDSLPNAENTILNILPKIEDAIEEITGRHIKVNTMRLSRISEFFNKQ